MDALLGQEGHPSQPHRTPPPVWPQFLTGDLPWSEASEYLTYKAILETDADLSRVSDRAARSLIAALLVWNPGCSAVPC